MMIEQLTSHRKPFHVEIRVAQPPMPNQKSIIINSDHKPNKKLRGSGRRSNNGRPDDCHNAIHDGHKQVFPECTSGETTHTLLAENLPDIQVEIAPPIFEPNDDFGWADFPLLSPILLDESFLPFDDSPEVSVAQEGDYM